MNKLLVSFYRYGLTSALFIFLCGTAFSDASLSASFVPIGTCIRLGFGAFEVYGLWILSIYFENPRDEFILLRLQDSSHPMLVVAALLIGIAGYVVGSFGLNFICAFTLGGALSSWILVGALIYSTFFALPAVRAGVKLVEAARILRKSSA